MAKSSSWANSLLQLVFNNVGTANVGDSAGISGSASAGNLYLALHTSDPTSTGNQSSNETAYTGYTRVAVQRSSSGFVVSNNSVNLAANADFPACTASPGNLITHFSIGTDATGNGTLLYSGTVTPPIPMNVGTIPRITTAANMVVES